MGERAGLRVWAVGAATPGMPCCPLKVPPSQAWVPRGRSTGTCANDKLELDQKQKLEEPQLQPSELTVRLPAILNHSPPRRLHSLR